MSDLFGTTSPAAKLREAAEAHIQLLRDRHLLGPEHELAATMVLHLAEKCVYAKAYSLANLHKELRETLELLPTIDAGDPWDRLLTWLNTTDQEPAK